MKRRDLNLIFTLGIFLVSGLFFTAEAQQAHGPTELPSVAHATSPPLRSYGVATPKKPFGPPRVIPLLRPEKAGAAVKGGGSTGPAPLVGGNWTDPDLQTTYGSSKLTVGTVFTGFTFSGDLPPDENVSVGINSTTGQTQIVGVDNTGYSIFDTSGNTLASGDLATTLFANLTNSVCSSEDGGDPIALFDKLDNRWIISQLAYNSTFTDNHLCLAISQSSDATGSYNLYDIPFNSNLPDYPKLAIWPDGIYFSANIYVPSGQTLAFTGAQACRIPRSDVTTPPPSGHITFQCSSGTDSSIYNILPADLENLPGTATLPTGSDYYLQFVDDLSPTSGNQLALYQFDPSSGSLNLVSDLPVKTFYEACGGGTCIPQETPAGIPPQQLDSLGDRLMYRLSFRAYGNYDQMVVNHSVQVSSGSPQTGIRWYAIRGGDGSPFFVSTESTFSPDSDYYRWMGSIGQNKNGDLGLGYSVSGVNSVPGIAVTGLLSGTDTLMEQEQRMYNGSDQSYQGSYSRWGDYTSISVDPTDDCSFWYTNEYVTPPVLSFDFLWRTVIGTFKFGDCSGTTFAIASGSLRPATLNAAYSATLPVNGGNGSYNSWVISGSLPAGLSLDSQTGVISGTPTATGTSTFTATVEDSTGQISRSGTLSITVSTASQLAVITPSLPDGIVNTAYNAQLAAGGGSGSYTWSLASGSQLPSSLFLSTSGAITGTPTTAGTTGFTVQVTDGSQTASANLSITVNAQLAVTTTSLPDGTVNTAYNAQLTASGGTTPYTWSMNSGNLPSGLSLSTSGAIIGTPTTTVTSNSFTVQVTDGSQTALSGNLSIIVNSASAPLAVTTNSLPSGTVNTTYNATLTATGGSGSYTWSNSGSLPPGLSLSTSGVISGTPTTAGSYPFSVTVKDSNGTTASANLSITVNPAPLAVTTTSLPSGTVNTAYNAQLNATGGTGSYTWSLAPGSLPSGLSLSTSGAISGTPTTATTTSFTVQVTDGSQTALSGTLSITVNAQSTGTFSLSASPGNLSLKSGQSGSYTVTVSPSGGFTGTVDLSESGCTPATNPPGPGVSCSFSYSTVAITGSGSVSTLLNVFDNGAGRTSTTIVITGANDANASQTSSTSVSLRTH